MDCPLFPRSSLSALLFASPKLPGPFRFDSVDYELLLCIGITPRELSRCRDSGSAVVVEELEASKVFPFTDIARDDAVRSS
jgi:hypothetical protein